MRIHIFDNRPKYNLQTCGFDLSEPITGDLKQCVWASYGIWPNSGLKSPPFPKNSLNTGRVVWT